MRYRKSVVVAVVGGATLFAFLAACSLATSFDGLTGGAARDAAPDARDAEVVSIDGGDGDGDGDGGDGRDGRADSGADAAIDGPAPSYATSVLADNPIAYYRFEETSGSVAIDSSARGRPGTYDGTVGFGAPGVRGGRAIHLSGNGAVLTGVTEDFAPDLPFSIEAWFAYEPSGNYARVVSNETFGPRQGLDWIFIDQDGGQSFGLERWRADNGSSFIGTPWTSRTLTYIVQRFASRKNELFVNGVSASVPDPAAGPVGSPGLPFALGQRPNGGNRILGVVDEVAFYDYALSDAQIAAHYAAGK